RAKWISKQLAQFRQYDGTVPLHQYLSGESHRYLGRQYRLRVTTAQNASRLQIGLARNELIVSVPFRPTPSVVKRILENWYLQRASDHFNWVLDENFKRFHRHGHERPRVLIRQMRRRWGSLSRAGNMTLNV